MTQNYGTGWQLISVPLTVVCPYVLDNSFEYKGSYVRRDTLENGRGYWNKLTTPELLFAGSSIEIDTVSVNEGWNMIGSISAPIPTSSIISDPPGITTSDFFGYSGSYIISDTIYPANGYWVKVNQPGLLILSSTPPLQTFARIRIVPTSELPPSPPGEKKEIAEIPKEFSLCEAYPNPFNPSTVIRYSLPVNSWVTLKIYNLLGQEISTLVDEFQDAGFRSVGWDASGIPTGMYFYRLQTKDYVETKKLILLR
jgi:hypothetical protein